MQQGWTLGDALVPQRTLLRQAYLVVAGTILVALSAQIRIYLPFTPVPVTGQTFAVLLVGAALGASRGASSLAFYILMGTLGLPVFAGGMGGINHLFGPTGGYLLGFVAAAAVTGRLAERRWDRQKRTAVLAMLAGNAVIYLFGLPWLALFVGPQGAIVKGLLPFIPGDIVKVLLAAAVLPTTWQAMGKQEV